MNPVRFHSQTSVGNVLRLTTANYWENALYRFLPIPGRLKKLRRLSKESFSARKPETYQAVLQIEKNRIWGRMHFRSIRMGESRSLLILVEDLTLEREQLVQKQKHEEELRHEIREREKIESALRDSEARYRLIVENTHDLIMVTGADGVISYVSSSCYRVLGWPPEELGRKTTVDDPFG